MIRIVGVQRSDQVGNEFVLLQNQGSMRLMLRGHALIGGSVLQGLSSGPIHVFTDEVYIGPGQYVLLFSKVGQPRWTVSKDSAHVYNAFMHQERPVWVNESEPIHILQTQHTYIERRQELQLV